MAASKAGTLASQITERQLQGAIIQCAETFGWLVYHPWTSIHSAGGYPDLTLTRGGRLILAELKSRRGALSPDQVIWLGALRQVRGVEVYEWRPDHWLSGEIEGVLR